MIAELDLLGSASMCRGQPWLLSYAIDGSPTDCVVMCGSRSFFRGHPVAFRSATILGDQDQRRLRTFATDFPVNFPVLKEILPRPDSLKLGAQPNTPIKTDGASGLRDSAALSVGCGGSVLAQTADRLLIWSNIPKCLQSAFAR